MLCSIGNRFSFLREDLPVLEEKLVKQKKDVIFFFLNLLQILHWNSVENFKHICVSVHCVQYMIFSTLLDIHVFCQAIVAIADFPLGL